MCTRCALMPNRMSFPKTTRHYAAQKHSAPSVNSCDCVLYIQLVLSLCGSVFSFYHSRMRGNAPVAPVYLSVCLYSFFCNFWIPLLTDVRFPGTSKSRSSIKVMGSRSRSRSYDRNWIHIFVGGLLSTKRRSCVLLLPLSVFFEHNAPVGDLL